MESKRVFFVAQLHFAPENTSLEKEITNLNPARITKNDGFQVRKFPFPGVYYQVQNVSFLI